MYIRVLHFGNSDWYTRIRGAVLRTKDAHVHDIHSSKLLNFYRRTGESTRRLAWQLVPLADYPMHMHLWLWLWPSDSHLLIVLETIVKVMFETLGVEY